MAQTREAVRRKTERSDQHVHRSRSDGRSEAGDRQAAHAVGGVRQVLRETPTDRRGPSDIREGDEGRLPTRRRPGERLV